MLHTCKTFQWPLLRRKSFSHFATRKYSFLRPTKDENKKVFACKFPMVFFQERRHTGILTINRMKFTAKNYWGAYAQLDSSYETVKPSISIERRLHGHAERGKNWLKRDAKAVKNLSYVAWNPTIPYHTIPYYAIPKPRERYKSKKWLEA